MRYNVDEQGYIANYAVVGDVTDGQSFEGELPEDFPARHRAYRIADGTLALDEARAAEMEMQQAAGAKDDPLAEYDALLLELNERMILQEMGV